MKLFGFRKRAEKENRVDEKSFGEDLLRALIGSTVIDEDAAMNIPKVAKSVHLLSDMVSMLPIKLFEESYVDGKKKVKEITNDVRLKLLNDETGDTLDGVQFKRAMVQDYLLYGNGYAFINKLGNHFKSIHYVANHYVSVAKSPDPIFKDFDMMVYGTNYKPYQFLKVLRSTKDGATGKGIIEENSELLKTAYATLQYEQMLVKTGGNKKGFVKSAKKLSQEAMNALKSAWNRLYGGNSTENVVVLNDGLDFQEASQTSVEMQMNEKKKTLDEQLVDLFNINMNDFEKTIREAVIPILTAFECALNRDFLLEKEKESFYFAFDTKDILKGDIKKRFEAYQIAVKAGWMTRNEIRYEEDLEEIEGLDVISMSLADVIYDIKTKTYFTPNTKQRDDLNSDKQTLSEGEVLEDAGE